MMSAARQRLQKRAHALNRARQFFIQRGLIETDCLMLGQSAAIDLHIDLFSVPSEIHGERYLFSSPEYPMKRLIANGAGDIFYLGHVFRHEDSGRHHSPEFTMAEWYRVGWRFSDIIQETVDFIIDSLQKPKNYWRTSYYSYKSLFERLLGVNPHTISQQELFETADRALKSEGLDARLDSSQSIDDLLHLLMATIIEPSLKKKKEIAVITHFPKSQAALAHACEIEGDLVSERFEIYVEGIEAANGYHELGCADELRARFQQDNELRRQAGKKSYPIDERFLSAMQQLPDCSGVAVGFDRLLMIAGNLDHIGDALPIAWNAT